MVLGGMRFGAVGAGETTRGLVALGDPCACLLKRLVPAHGLRFGCNAILAAEGCRCPSTGLRNLGTHSGGLAWGPLAKKGVSLPLGIGWGGVAG